MALRTLAQILSDLPDNQARQITPEILRDCFSSLVAVGGTLYSTDVTAPITTAWGAFAGYEASQDTKGLTPDLVNGQFTVGEGAGGLYAVDASVSIVAPANGRVEVALAKNGALTPYRAIVDLAANQARQFVVQGSGDLAEGDTIALTWKGPGNATITVLSAQFRAVRV